MSGADDTTRLEELKKSLYSRNTPDVRTRRSLRYSEDENSVKTSWGDAPPDFIDPVLTTDYEDHSMSFFSKLLIGSGIFCLIAVALGAYTLLGGANLISADNIDITVSGPVSIPGGAPVSCDIQVSNKNNVSLELADLSVEFPAGAVEALDTTRELKTYRELIGNIPAGGSATKTVKAVMFGEENVQKQILVTVTYKIKGSTSLFSKKKSYDVLISSSPLSMTVSAFKEITSGQEIDITVKIESHSGEILKNVLLKVSYPFGFTFISSNPKPFKSNDTWKIGDIPAGASRTITIHGKIAGEDGDIRVFRLTTGAQSPRDPAIIATEYMSVQQDITIQKPFISLGVGIDNDTSVGDFIGRFNQSSRVEISWFNNIPTAVSHGEIVVRLSGTAYDKASVRPDRGIFRSATNEIVWNQQTNTELASMGAGESGRVSFSLIPRDTGTASRPIVDPVVTIEASVSGSRTQESSVPETLASAVSRIIKVSSNVALTGRMVRSIGPFANTGPIPPRAEQPTTYTVIWTVDNTSSSVANAKVAATLAPGVKWLGASPTEEKVTFEANTGTVTWDIGSVNTYTFNSSRRREAFFQISVMPSVSDVGQPLTLVNQAILTATDTFTGEGLQSIQEYLTTRFGTDPIYKNGDEIVGR